MVNEYRVEEDLIGAKEVPASAYYGIQTVRAKENFNITGYTIKKELIVAIAIVKKAAAIANIETGHLDPTIGEAIIQAADEIIRGELHDQFIVDPIQGGAGTSINMNANEVIANLALARLGRAKGQYQYLHPNNDVNRSQSTNDAYPSAARLAVTFSVQGLQKALQELQLSLAAKGREFSDILKMGRTQMQDAVPMTLGQEFSAFASTLREEIRQLDISCHLLYEINLGGTAIGTGINAPAHYGKLVLAELAGISQLPVRQAKDLIAASYDMGGFVTLSSNLKRLSIKLSKLSNDLRLLSSGPRTGLGEISLPAMQPGSSIMPGKVNPVIPEAMSQAAFQIMGSDTSISMAAEAGQLQLNAMEPLIVYQLLNNCRLLTRAVTMLDRLCIRGIKANQQRCADYVEQSIGIITALVPHIGYDKASQIAKEALEKNKNVTELVREQDLLNPQTLKDILSPRNMLQQG